MLHLIRNIGITQPRILLRTPIEKGINNEPRGNSICTIGSRRARRQQLRLDKAGQTILQLLNKAADVAEQNSRHAIDTAQRLSHQLRAAEDRIAELEAEVEAYRQQAERAEQWLHKVYTEIEDRLLDRDKNAPPTCVVTKTER